MMKSMNTRSVVKPSSTAQTPLDLATVKRTSDHTPRTRPRIFGLKEAPTYYPTAKEFTDPIKYVQSIRAEAEDYGIVKIVPPKGWSPEFSLDTEVSNVYYSRSLAIERLFPKHLKGYYPNVLHQPTNILPMPQISIPPSQLAIYTSILFIVAPFSAISRIMNHNHNLDSPSLCLIDLFTDILLPFFVYFRSFDFVLESKN
jgi:hypothetical protein